MTTYTKDDLHALDDAAFNRVIAEMAGWRIEQEMVGGNTFKIIVPPATAQDAIRPFRLARDLEDALPRYASSLDAAWGLFTPNVGAILEYDHDEHFATVQWWASNYLNRIVVEHASPARALATAWALWKQERTP